MTAEPARIHLLRHGQIPQSSPRRFVGQSDPPLDETGLAQAEAARKALAPLTFTRVLASDLRRTMRTAEIVCRDRAVEITQEPKLREINLGLWEGLSVAEVQERFPGQYERRGLDLTGFRPEGGESFQDLQDRAWPVLEGLASTDSGAHGDILVVTHAGVIRVLVCRVLDLPVSRLFRLDQNYCGLSTLAVTRGGTLRVERLNQRLWGLAPDTPLEP